MVAEVNLLKFDNASELLRAIAHPVRLAIIELLGRREALSVTEIHDQLGIEQATASHHLKILRYHQVVEAKRKGRFTFYSLTGEDFREILGILQRLSGRSAA